MPVGLASTVEGFGGFPKAVRLCAPPRGFRSAEGVRSARLTPAGPFGSGPRPLRGSGAQKAGLRYERKVLSLLAECFPNFQASPWFQFDDPSGLRWCQPDGLWQSPDKQSVILFEVKIRFTADAWYQLRRLYVPVVQKALAPKSISLVNICRSFDPAVLFPEEVRHLEKIDVETASSEPGRIGVYTWKL